MEQAVEKLVFNKTNIDKLPLSKDGKPVVVYDKQLTGFGLRIGATAKTFFVYKRLPNSRTPKRVTLGRYPVLTVEKAKQLAMQELSNLTLGIDTSEEKKKTNILSEIEELRNTQTLQWVYDQYKNEHIVKNKGARFGTLKSIDQSIEYISERKIRLLKASKPNKDGVITYEFDKELILPSLLDRPFRSITKKEILERFDLYSMSAAKHSLTPIVRTHQIAFKFLASAINFIIPRLEDEEDISNPCDVLKSFKRWKKSNKKTRRVVLEKKEGKQWFKELLEYRKKNPTASDYILVSLLQAGRSAEVYKLEWDQIDLELQLIHYGKTKNFETSKVGIEYSLPMSKKVYEILKQRHEEKGNSNYVFAYQEAYKHKVINKSAKPYFEYLAEASGVLISHHDLRRTWGSTANLEALNIKERTIDYCLKHTIDDVNEHYLERNIDSIKSAFQKVEDYFFEKLAELEKAE